MRSFVLFFGVLSVLASQPASDADLSLIRALQLTDAQIAELRAPVPLTVRMSLAGARVQSYGAARDALRGIVPVLRSSVLDNTQRAILAEIEKPFADLSIRASAITMGLIDETKWGGPGLCPSTNRIIAEAYGLSDAQVREFNRIEYEARQQNIHARPRRDVALALLNQSELAKLAEYESNLELGSEAVELHLLAPPPVNAEVLCH